MLKDLFSMIMLKYIQCSDIVIVLFLIFLSSDGSISAGLKM